MRGYMEMYSAYIMRKVAFCLIILILFVFAGCQPMPYDELGDASNSLPFDRETYEISASDDGEYIEVKFEIIPKAKSYGYGATSKDVKRISEENLTFSDGYYVAKIEKNDPVFSSDDTPAAASRAAAGNLSVIIFASSNSTPSNDWVMVKSVDVELSLTTAPDFTTSNRKEDSVILKANSESIAGGMEYKVDYGTGKSVTFSSSNLPYTLEGIGTDALTLTVSHRYAGTSEYSAQTQTLTVSEYDPRQGAIITDINEVDGSIKASNLEAGHNYVGIFSVGADGKLASTPIYKQTYSGDSVTFDKTVVFGEGFYAGKIKVVLYNNSSADEDAVLGDEKEYVSPIEKVNEKIGRQSYSVTIPVSDKISVSNVTVSGNSNITASIDSDGNIQINTNYKTINAEAPQVGTLESKREYNFNLNISVSGYRQISKSIAFTTKSFDGEYIWERGSMQFAVVVDSLNVPSASDFEYYIFVSENDVLNTDKRTDLRLAPLVDESAGEPAVNNTPYSNAPEAYIWNNNKWNSKINGIGKVESVKSIENKETNSCDSFSTTVVSVAAMLGVEATTKTTIDLYETFDGKCYLIFYNKIQGSGFTVNQGNNALNKNPSPDSSRFEKDEYYYALELQ